jgi:hypothetical protein
MRRLLLASALSASILLASSTNADAIGGSTPPTTAARPKSPPVVVDTSTTTASTTPTGYEVYQANTRVAMAAQASSCRWVHVPRVQIDFSNPDGFIGDALDPVTGRMIRLYQDCNGIYYSVLDPTPGEVATWLWENRLQALIKPSKVGMQPVDDIGAIVKVDTWYWLETFNAPINASDSFMGVPASITARPTTITTTWGDGNTTTCTAPGIDYATATHPKLYREPDPAPDGGCSYRYTTHSGKQPGQKFTVTTTVTWEASWTSGTIGGTFAPVTRQTVNQLKVDQIQSILTKP